MAAAVVFFGWRLTSLRCGSLSVLSPFFDIPHTQKPHAGNFAELHPVTGIKFVSGCGA
jgi:hypothetical protein